MRRRFMTPSGSAPLLVDLCDIVYVNNKQLKACKLDEWSDDLGTAIGVVVIPSNFVPDGLARIVNLSRIDKNGIACESYISMKWSLSEISEDTALPNYLHVVTTDNTSATSMIDTTTQGMLPSDRFSSGTQSFVDNKSKYNASKLWCPSPYLGDDKTFNPIYGIDTFDNALSDFNGLSNSELLVNTYGSGCEAAYASWNYKDGISNLQWYLPSAGELGIMYVRIKQISTVITSIGGFTLNSGGGYMSSTEGQSRGGMQIYSLDNGNIVGNMKTDGKLVRLFALI